MHRENHTPKTKNTPKPIVNKAPAKADESTPDMVAQDEVQPGYYTQRQVMLLQRRIGNQATLNMLNGKPVQRSPLPSLFVQRDTSPAGSVSIDDDDDELSESYSESEEDERDVPMAYDDEAPAVPDTATLREEMGELKYRGLADKYGWGPVNDLCDLLIDTLINEGEAALADYEIAAIRYRLIEKKLHTDKREQILEASPTISAAIESRKAAERQSDYNHIMSLLRGEGEVNTLHASFLLKARQYYFKGAPDDFPYTDEMRALIETDAWSWLRADGIDTPDDVSRLYSARREMAEAQDKKVDQVVDPLSAATEGGTKTALTGSRIIGITEGIDTLSQIDNETRGKDLVTSGMENLALSITQKVFAPISIGADLLKAFHYHKTRRDGYYAAMGRSGVKDDGTTEVKPDTAKDIERIRLGQVAYYAFKKTRRAFWSTITRMMLKVVKWIAHIITVLSGGTTAVVTGAIALSADVTRSLMGIGANIKGVYKTLMGKRGVMRKKNASELMSLAERGNEDALQTIWDVNPFDEASKVSKSMWNETKGLGIFGGHITELPKPDSFDDFKQQFKDGYYSERRARAALTTALRNTMKST